MTNERQVEEVPEPWAWCKRPEGVFRGVNIMTPELEGFAKATVAGSVVYVEISRERYPYFSQTVGRNPNGGPAIGLTFKRPDGRKMDPDPSRCVHSPEEVADVLREVAGRTVTP